MKNLRRKTVLHYFKQTCSYVPVGDLRKRLLHELHDVLLAGHKGLRAIMAKFPKIIFLDLCRRGHRRVCQNMH